MNCPLDQPIQHSAVTELRAVILEIHVRLAQGIEDLPEGVVYAGIITDSMSLVNGGSFGNIYRPTAGSGKCLALKEPRRLGAREMPVYLLAAPATPVYPI